tara:strand:+ start:159 stop:1715 length:1557 start_codon:yes stop_codon:yes gene_type:complete
MENLQNKINKVLDLYKHKKLSQAETLVKKLIKANSKIVILYNFYGLILTEQKKFNHAINAFEEGIKMKPDYSVCYANLANIYKLQEKYFEAESLYKKAIALDSKLLDPINNLGTLYLNQNRTTDAIDCFKKVLNINPNYFVANYNLGIAHKNLGKFSDAKIYLNKALKSNKYLFSAHRALGQIINYNKHNSHLNILTELFEDKKVNLSDKAELAFSLGKAYDDLELYKKAFNYYKIGNDIRKKTFKFSLSEEKSEFDLIKNFFKKETLNKLTKSKNNDKSSIFVLGMPRSGTTLIEQIISNHKNVYGGDELNFLPTLVKENFTDKNGNLSFNRIKNFTEDDLSLIAKNYTTKTKDLSNNSLKVTDKLPINFKWIGLIKLILPNSKIIHCTRNPRDNCISIYKNYFTSTELNYAYDLDNIIEFYKLYSNLMEHWKKEFKNFIFDISYERLIKNPENEIKSLINFCNLDWQNDCLKFYENKRVVKTASDTQIRKKIYSSSIDSWKKYKNELDLYFKKFQI